MEPDSLSFLTPITKHSHSVFSILQNTPASHQAQDDVYFKANVPGGGGVLKELLGGDVPLGPWTLNLY